MFSVSPHLKDSSAGKQKVAWKLVLLSSINAERSTPQCDWLCAKIEKHHGRSWAGKVLGGNRALSKMQNNLFLNGVCLIITETFRKCQ